MREEKQEYLELTDYYFTDLIPTLLNYCKSNIIIDPEEYKKFMSDLVAILNEIIYAYKTKMEALCKKM